MPSLCLLSAVALLVAPVSAHSDFLSAEKMSKRAVISTDAAAASKHKHQGGEKNLNPLLLQENVAYL
jgi:hypothetical protein